MFTAGGIESTLNPFITAPTFLGTTYLYYCSLLFSSLKYVISQQQPDRL